MPREEHWRHRLIELMTHLKVSQVAFAEKTGIDPTYVSRLLYPPGKKGRKNLGLDTMRSICTAYSLRTDWFDQPTSTALPGFEGTFAPATAEPSATGNMIPLPLFTEEGSSKEYKTRTWPFQAASHQRLMALKKLLGVDYAVALRDIEEQLDTAILKWEVRAANKKGQHQSA